MTTPEAQIPVTHWVPRLDDFASRIAVVRHKMGWNAKEAALACGLPQNSWREWEMHGREPRGLTRIAEQISNRTGVDKYWLITGETISEQHPTDSGPPAGESRKNAGLRIKSPKLYQLSYRGAVSDRTRRMANSAVGHCKRHVA